MQYLLQDDEARPMMIVEAASTEDADYYGRVNLPRYSGFVIALDADTESALVATEGHLNFLPTATVEPAENPPPAEDLIMFDHDLALQIALHCMGLSLHPL